MTRRSGSPSLPQGDHFRYFAWYSDSPEARGYPVPAFADRVDVEHWVEVMERCGILGALIGVEERAETER